MLSFNQLGQQGRFGNQMFQYAALLGIASRHGYEFCVPPSTAQDLWREHQLFQAFYLPSLKVIGCQRDANTIEEASFAYDLSLAQSCPDNVDLRGYFQTERYFEDIKDQITREFAFRREVEQYCQDEIKKLKQPVISLHVRRTDYLTSNGAFPPCGIDYYERSLEFLPKSLPVMVFSDDIEWCMKQKLFQGSRWFFSRGRQKWFFGRVKSNIADMCMMTFCSHHIIANSSFSWWGAYLGRNPNKIVVAPKRWFGLHVSHDTSDLLPSSWLTT